MPQRIKRRPLEVEKNIWETPNRSPNRKKSRGVEPSSTETRKYDTPNTDATVDYGSPQGTIGGLPVSQPSAPKPSGGLPVSQPGNGKRTSSQPRSHQATRETFQADAKGVRSIQVQLPESHGAH